MTRPTPATEFFAALTDLLLGADQHPKPARKPIACNACLDTGSTEQGGPCNWCGPQDIGSDELVGSVEEY
jgi:hypothetical protein